MTREQHLAAARRFGSLVGFALRLHPSAAEENAILAAHHARAAQTCERCNGSGCDPDIPYEDCQKCYGDCWLSRAEDIQ